MSLKDTRLSNSFYRKKVKKDMSPTKGSIIEDFESPTTVPREKDVEIINLTDNHVANGTLLANPKAVVSKQFETALLGAKSRLCLPKKTMDTSANEKNLMKNYHLSSASSLPKLRGHTPTSTNASCSNSRQRSEEVESPSCPPRTKLAETAGEEAMSERGAEVVSSPYFLDSGNSMQYSSAKVPASDCEPVVISPSPTTLKFNDTSLGLESENAVFSNSNTRPTSSEKSSFPALDRDAVPTLSAGDFFIPSSSKKRKKSGEDEVIFQKEEPAGLKQYPKRVNRGVSSVSRGETLQRSPLHTQQYKYDNLIDEARRNINNPCLGKSKEQQSESDVAMMMTKYGKIKPPVLKKKDTSSVAKLAHCQIGRLLMDTGSFLELERNSMRILSAYKTTPVRVEIGYKDIEEFKHYNGEIILLCLRPGPVRQLSNVLGQKLSLESDFFRYIMHPVRTESVITLQCRNKLPELDRLISGLKTESYSSLQCHVEDLSEEEMTKLLDSVKPVGSPQKKRAPSFSTHGGDSVVGSEVVSGSNASSFYNQEFTTSAIPSTESSRPHNNAPRRNRLLSLTQRHRLSSRDSGSSADSSKSGDNKWSTQDSTWQRPTSESRPSSRNSQRKYRNCGFERSNSPAEDTDFVSDPTAKDVEACSLPPRRSTRLSTLQEERPNVKVLNYKPKGCKDGVELMSMDVETLDPGEFLNDKIMDFYLKYMMFEMLEEELRANLHIFSTFFYTRMSNSSMDNKALSNMERVHNRVKTWTRHVDLFNKEFIVIPVCDRSHWYVVLICRPGSFDPSKAKVMPKQSRSKRRKSTKPRKRTSKVTSEHLKNPDFDSLKGAGSDTEEVVGVVGDPLHVKSYNSDEDGGEEEGAEFKVPGERIAAALANTDTFQQQEEEEDPISVFETPPSTQLSVLSPAEKYLFTDPGMGMWAGAPCPEAQDDMSGDYAEEGGGPMDCSVGQEGCDSGDVIGEADMEWEKEEGKGVKVKLEGAEEEEEKEESSESYLLVLDSLGIRRQTAATRVRNYLTEEWRTKKQEATGKELKFDHLPLRKAQIPLQDNYSDCGIFVLQYVETVVRCLQKNEPLPQHSDGWGYSHIGGKREHIQSLIREKQRT